MKEKKSDITRTGSKARVTPDDRESAEEQQPVQKYFITVIAVWLNVSLLSQDGV